MRYTRPEGCAIYDTQPPLLQPQPQPLNSVSYGQPAIYGHLSQPWHKLDQTELGQREDGKSSCKFIDGKNKLSNDISKNVCCG